MLPIDAKFIEQLKNESEADVAFVSGMQGLIITTFMVEVQTPIIGGSKPTLAFGYAEYAIHTGIFTTREILPN